MSAAYWNGILRAHAQLGKRRTAHKGSVTGWTDDRMMSAYDAIHEVMRDNPAAATEFRAVLRAIEAADELLIEIQGEQA